MIFEFLVIIVGPAIWGHVKDKNYNQKFKDFLTKFQFDSKGNILEKSIVKNNKIFDKFRKSVWSILVTNWIINTDNIKQESN